MPSLSIRWIIQPDPQGTSASWLDLQDDLPPDLLPPFLGYPSLGRCFRIDGLDPTSASLLAALASQSGLESAFFPFLSPPLFLLETHPSRFPVFLSSAHSDLPAPLPSVLSTLTSFFSASQTTPLSWTLRQTTLDFSKGPLLMGIVNVTPDSFSDGGLFFTPQKATEHALSLIEQGADILDIGGESTRPGSLPISEAEEMDRILPVLTALAPVCPIPISVDTTKASVAEAALQAGASILNDVSLLRFDPRLADIAAKYKAPLILMHSRHTPALMQKAPFYRSLWGEIISEIDAALRLALSAGIPRHQIALDPGLCFSKRPQDNYRILREWPVLRSFGLPLLLGASRKSFLATITKLPPHERLEGSLAAAAFAASSGIDILRVHDVASTRKLLQVTTAIRRPFFA